MTFLDNLNRGCAALWETFARLIRSPSLKAFLSFAAAFTMANQAVAQVSDCNQLIELSKNTSQTISSASLFQSYEHAFCSDYSSYKSSGKSMSAGASYGPISGTFGQSSNSLEAVASQYCENDGSINQSSNMFNDYVQQIAPGAYAAYTNCITLEHSNITFNFSGGTVQPTYAEYTVNNLDNNNQNSDEITFTEYPGINCNWQGRPASQATYRVYGSGFGRLQCRRHDANTDGFVTMTAAHSPVAQVAIPWPRYVGGAPISVVQQYQQATEAANALATSMSGAVVAFNATSCPIGWTTYGPAEGRFIRGITTAGDKTLDPEGLRAPGSKQADDFKSHTHGLSGAKVILESPGGNSAGQGSEGVRIQVQPPTDPAGGDETRPKNVALLYCLKN
jgi:hypothetical protein